VEFVTAAANLRAHSFGIPMQSLFEAKGMAGNIIHAIATTNAIIAGLIVLEALKILSNKTKECRCVYFSLFKLTTSFLALHLWSCGLRFHHNMVLQVFISFRHAFES
jgi:hypothetical protein